MQVGVHAVFVEEAMRMLSCERVKIMSGRK